MTLIPNKEFTKLASNAQIERTVKALEANGMHALDRRKWRRGEEDCSWLGSRERGSLYQSIQNA